MPNCFVALEFLSNHVSILFCNVATSICVAYCLVEAVAVCVMFLTLLIVCSRMRILPIYFSALIEPELPNISASLLTLSKSISICAKVECNSVCTEPAPRASIFVFNAVTCVLIFSISKPKSPLLTLLLNVWIILLLVSSNLLSKTLSLFSASPAVCFSVFSCEADNFPSKPFLRKLYCFRRFSN